MFEDSLTSTWVVGNPRSARLARVAAGLEGVSRGTERVRALAAEGLAVPEALAPLLPRGLERGGVLCVDQDRYLAASLVGTAVRSGGSAALVGLDDLGIEAVAAAGAPTSRLVVVRPDPSSWVKAVEVLIGAVEVVLVRPPAAVGDALARRITARLRRSAAVGTSLLVAGPAAFPAPVRLRVAQARWAGLEAGHGQLTARRATVVAEGRAVGGGPRSAELYLPGPDGAPHPVEATRTVDAPAARRRLVAA
jgi:hypothetical protein